MRQVRLSGPGPSVGRRRVRVLSRQEAIGPAAELVDAAPGGAAVRLPVLRMTPEETRGVNTS